MKALNAHRFDKCSKQAAVALTRRQHRYPIQWMLNFQNHLHRCVCSTCINRIIQPCMFDQITSANPGHSKEEALHRRQEHN
mmetsp:Transcript_33589/g.53617  ORF Transcript_33589/g.53617 Transcript_33589/m.53617 type:complete len:81 (+) Transcript_33589:186-428(+)